MLWIVRIALSRPYTFIVLALLIMILGPLVYANMRTDIFPDIKVPVVSAVWAYNGLPPEDMSNRIVTYYERQLSTAVNDIEHIESQSLPGVAVVKIFFQPDVNINAAVSQVTALSQTVLKRLPPGITPPLIISYNASSVPVMQLSLSSDTLLDNQLFDISNNFIRPVLAQVRAAIPSPYGGKNRQVQVDLDMEALRSKGLTPQNVTGAILSQNLIIPAGTEKMGDYEYNVKLNSSPNVLDELNDLPIRSVNGATILLRDVAHVRDGFSPQQNMVRVNGKHSVLTTIQKNGSASTLDIIANVKALLPRIMAGAPAGLVLDIVGDQSVFVKSAVNGVIREGVIAAALTGLMILLFLGSWRSTLIITISIPLAILSAIVALAAFGQTLNVMTLGGLALAVGILVDDATVTIENMNWHLEQGKHVEASIMDGAHQIVVPAFVSLLCICIVFIPMFFLEGVAKFLFVPLAEAVIFSMIASFILSRTLVPTLAKYLLHAHPQARHPDAGGGPRASGNPLIRLQHAFERGFSRVREKYRTLLLDALSHRRNFILGFLGFVSVSFALVPWLGQNFFPAVDAGEIKLHIRAPTGTRIEETARLCDEIEREIRQEIPPGEIRNILDNIGLPISGINLAYSNSSPIGPADADILISLNRAHRPTAQYVKTLREHLKDNFPGVSFAFLPADIVSQILNFGMPAPINVQVAGFNRRANEEYAASILSRIRKIPGLVDVRIQQAFNQPELHVDVNRLRARELGLTQSDVATNLLVSLSGSLQTAPNFWVNPDNKVSYPLVVQAPQPRLDTLSDLQNIPLAPAQGAAAQPELLGDVASISRGQGEAVVSHYDVEPTIDIFGSAQERDLGDVAHDIEEVLKDTANDVPKGSFVVMRGQVKAMDESYSGLLFGLLGAIVLIYLLIVVNFQSWLDPFVIITALPAALAGIVWMLFVTHTTLSVPALIGSIMCMGVATANSILVVSFARERMREGDSGITAALEAGFIRFRPVLMTALAMMIGMAPMALGLGEGGEQNAPLGRAVIGGLAFATCATLFFVPVVFSLVHREHAASGAQTPLDWGAGRSAGHIPHVPTPARLLAIGLVLLTIAGVVAVAGILFRISHAHDLQSEVDSQRVTVKVVSPEPGGDAQTLILPGNVRADLDAPIYARVSGYLKNWYTDIGAHVKKGQLLGEIETPELDQQIMRARADVAAAESNRDIAELTSKRWQNLLATDSVSRQEADEKTANARAGKDMLEAAQANLESLLADQSFQRIVAPFDGIVTERNTDIGKLINPGSSNGQALFRVVDNHRLRVFMEAPQNYANQITPGMKAQVHFPELPGRQFAAVVLSTSNALRESSRTSTVELLMNNPDGRLFSGSYAEVHLELPSHSKVLRLPVSTLLFRKEGLEVATVGADNRVALKPIAIARDLGRVVEVANGLESRDRVVDHPTDSIVQGEVVRIKDTQASFAGRAPLELKTGTAD